MALDTPVDPTAITLRKILQNPALDVSRQLSEQYAQMMPDLSGLFPVQAQLAEMAAGIVARAQMPIFDHIDRLMAGIAQMPSFTFPAAELAASIAQQQARIMPDMSWIQEAVASLPRANLTLLEELVDATIEDVVEDLDEETRRRLSNPFPHVSPAKFLVTLGGVWGLIKLAEPQWDAEWIPLVAIMITMIVLALENT